MLRGRVSISLSRHINAAPAVRLSLPRGANLGTISRTAREIRDHIEAKIKKLTWDGEAAEMSTLYQLATVGHGQSGILEPLPCLSPPSKETPSVP